MNEVNWEPYLNREISILCADKNEAMELVALAESDNVPIYKRKNWFALYRNDLYEFCVPGQDCIGIAHARGGKSFYVERGCVAAAVPFQEFISTCECTADAQFNESSFFELIGG